jgi:AAA+ superfamily predicted ATPase
VNSARRIDRPTIVWLAATTAVALGIIAITIPFERRVQQARVATQDAVRRAIANERAIANGPRIDRTAAAIERELRGLRDAPTPSTTTAALLVDLDRLAHREGITTVAVSPQTTVPNSVSKERPSAERHSALSSDDALLVIVRGDYRGIVAYVDELSTMAMPVRVVSTDLERLDHDPGGAPLQGSIRLQTVHLRRDLP